MSGPRKVPTLLIGTRSRFTKWLAQVLGRAGFAVTQRSDPRRALALVGRLRPAVVFIAPEGLTLEARDLCQMVRARLVDTFVPILLVDGSLTAEQARACVQAGADEFLAQPDDEEAILVRIQAWLRIKRFHDELAEANRALLQLSMRDPLTGLYNRNYFYENLAIELERTRRYARPISCIMVDIDHFKPVNDQYGHVFGDLVLSKLVALLRDATRRFEMVARYGGEEFTITMPNTTTKAAAVLAERLRRRVARETFREGPVKVKLTISCGVATFLPGRVGDPDELVNQADAAMYLAKNRGRNQVATYDEVLGKGNFAPPTAEAAGGARKTGARASTVRPRPRQKGAATKGRED